MDIKDLLTGEIYRQCIFGIMAYDELTKSLESIMESEADQLDRFWYSIQTFLIAVSNISKLLWPSAPLGSEITPETSNRREALRSFLGMEESSPLKPKKLRNYFEQYDSELEEWASRSTDRMIIDSNVGPLQLSPGGTSAPIAYMRNFDPVRFTLVFRDEEYQIKEIAKAINELAQKIQINHS
jgi:hypothetical protein